jgi:uncharacterized protein (TIGR00251 family)
MNVGEKNGAITFDLRVVTRASRSEIIGSYDGALKIRIASPPIGGAANVELIKLLAKKLCIAKSDISIVAGETSKNKRVQINNLSRTRFDALIK